MVRLTVMIIIGLLILSFFGISLRTLVLSPTAQDNFAFAWNFFMQGWDWIVAWVQNVIYSIQHIAL